MFERIKKKNAYIFLPSTGLLKKSFNCEISMNFTSLRLKATLILGVIVSFSVATVSTIDNNEKLAAKNAKYFIPKKDNKLPVIGPSKNPIPNATPLKANALLRSSFLEISAR